VSFTWAVVVVCLWVSVLLLGFVVLGLLRRIVPLLEARPGALGWDQVLGGLSPGSRVAPFLATDSSGRGVDESLFQKSASLVLFIERGCEPCEVLAQEMRNSPDWSQGIRAFVVAGPGWDERAFASGLSTTVLIEHDGSVTAAFDNSFYPVAYRVSAQGIVTGRRNPSSLEDLRDMVAEVRKEVKRRSPVPTSETIERR
jgi:hypothetical protein